ncbi:MAG: 4-(cytidine 5'-diphospho)-2-C-methyl-D-erythritol kinase, partial [Verrucomicrobiota bacterium]
KDELRELAAAIGSDCPFFIDAVPAVMRGRGEILEPLDAATGARLRGMPVILFRPDFAVGTAWAYGQLVAGAPESYESEAHGLARIERFIEGGPEAALLNNSFEAAVGQKYLAIPTLLDALRTEGYAVLMSGSGSCCFALGECNRKKLKQILNAAWGEGVFWVETTIR